MEARVRFAPSPTGNVHIGNIRTAIFNWLHARHEGGKFLLRIEDTDRERSTDEAIANLLEVMEWLELDVDEEPLYQSRQREQHLQAAEQLVASGHAYRHAKGEGGEATLFAIPTDPADIPFLRSAGETTVAIHADEPIRLDRTGINYALVSKKGKPMPQACSLGGMPHLVINDAAGAPIFQLDDELQALLDGEERVVEGGASITFERYLVVYQDEIKGELGKPLDSLKDLVIVRSDGSPVFHLANVVDDIAQGITHIIRGDDHVENTYRHLFLFHALGATPPAYGHLPMIVNQQGKPYSKRDGDAYVGDFRAKGYLPEALFNYLTLLGWSPGDDREKMSRRELIEAFSLSRVKSAAAQMDLVKLENLNGQYMSEMPDQVFVQLAYEQIEDEPWMEDADPDYVEQVAKLMQSRTKLLTGVGEWSYFFTDDIEYDEKAVRKNLQKEGVRDALEELGERLVDSDFSVEQVEAAIHATTEACDIKRGKLNQPIRVAVTGTTVGAGIYEIVSLLGPERALPRLEYAIDHLC